MDMFLSLTAERRRILCEEGQQSLGLAPAGIEKDFWVCWTLQELFSLPVWGEHLTFKGGTYDLWCLIQKGVAAQAMADNELFKHCAEHRQVFFKQSWVDYATLRKGSLHLLPLSDQLAEWRQDYEAMRGEMFINTPPSFADVIEVIRKFEEEFNSSE